MRQSCRGMVEQHSNVAVICLFGTTFLIGFQVFVALLWDHEEMIARPKCSSPWDLVRAKEQWLAIMASTLLVFCLWLQQTFVAYDEDRRCEFHGEQTALANERLMISWSVLVIVMFCIAMFAGIMPGCSGGCVQTMQKLKRLRPLGQK